ncbi:MAG: hypothetical protein HY475_01365 [Candidatus Terrybacteria bacterium]|nr:hypothetical protein [Candidatus Terrybacteria bacterium]
MFKVTIALEDVGKHDTFPKAFRDFYEKVKALVEGGTTEQVLFTTNFVTYCEGGAELPMEFSQVADFAREIGLLNEEGQLQELQTDPAPEVVKAAFMRVAREYVTSPGALFPEIAVSALAAIETAE